MMMTVVVMMMMIISPHFTDEKTKAQTSLGSPNLKMGF